MKTIAYLRVSTAQQDLEKNKSDILKLSNEKKLGHVDWVEEKVSGKTSWKKRKLAQVIEDLKKGDNVIVSELSRLGRSMLEVMEILSICTEKEINVYAVKGNWVLDSSIQSKLVAMCFAMASEIERELISQRTKEALATRKAQGVILGRPKGINTSKLDEHRQAILTFLKNGATKKFIADIYIKQGIIKSYQTLLNWVKQNSKNERTIK
jgi:DNA invertase Pin-like site-specific DNA recombinase